MTLINTLSELHPLKDVPQSKQWFVYSNVTPRFHFNHFVCESSNRNLICLTTVRGEYVPQHVAQFLTFLETFKDKMGDFIGVVLKVSWHGGSEIKMDHAMFLKPEGHSLLKTENSFLHAHTLVAFPIYDCEFSGDESAEEIVLMRKEFVATIDWNRNPQPKVRLRFDNPQTKGGTIGKHLGFSKLETVQREIRNLSGVQKGFIEMENFKGTRIKIISTKDDYYSIYNGHEKELCAGSLKTTLNTVSHFLVRGSLNA